MKATPTVSALISLPISSFPAFHRFFFDQGIICQDAGAVRTGSWAEQTAVL